MLVGLTHIPGSVTLGDDPDFMKKSSTNKIPTAENIFQSGPTLSTSLKIAAVGAVIVATGIALNSFGIDNSATLSGVTMVAGFLPMMYGVLAAVGAKTGNEFSERKKDFTENELSKPLSLEDITGNISSLRNKSFGEKSENKFNQKI